MESTVNPFYPSEAVAEASANAPRVPAQSEFVEQHGCRSSLLWQTFHFAFVSPVVENVDLSDWLNVPEFISGFDEKGNFWDPDFVDAASLEESCAFTRRSCAFTFYTIAGDAWLTWIYKKQSSCD